MNTITRWHASDDTLRTYASDPRSLNDATAASLEAHLTECGRCRDRLAAAYDAKALTAVASLEWDEIVDAVDQPRPRLVERIVRAGGASAATARLVAATPGSQLASIAAALLLGFAASAAGDHPDSHMLFLMVAPLVPLLSVTVAFLPGADPAGEAGLVTPVSGLSLMARRALSLTGASMVALVVGSAGHPALHATEATWLLPGVALAAACTALATQRPIEHAAALCAAAWILGMLVLRMFMATPAVHTTVVFRPPGQVAAFLIATACMSVTFTRRDRLVPLGGS